MTTIGIRCALFALLASASALGGCAWQSGDEPVYYNETHRHELTGESSANRGSAGSPGIGGDLPVEPTLNDPTTGGGGTGNCSGPINCDPIPNPWDKDPHGGSIGGGGAAGHSSTAH